MRIKVDNDKCTGCRLCELFCSFQKKGVFSRSASRIRVKTNFKEIRNEIYVCLHCEAHECIEVCPTDAIRYNKNRDMIEIIEDSCSLCYECLNLQCLGVMFDGEEKNPQICDLCNGEPECVGVCPTKALSVEYSSDIV